MHGLNGLVLLKKIRGKCVPQGSEDAPHVDTFLISAIDCFTAEKVSSVPTARTPELVGTNTAAGKVS
jgi:hypothetical protein